MKPPGSWATVYGFAIIGILIQLVACFNFTNLATARATMRAREVSLAQGDGRDPASAGHPVPGRVAADEPAGAGCWRWRWWKCLLPSFDQFLGRPISFNYVTDWPVLACPRSASPWSPVFWAASIRPLCFPASGPPPSCAPIRPGQGGSGVLRTVLVVLQFAVSIGLGIAALVIFAQISFARNMDLGFRKDNVVIIGAPAACRRRRATRFERALRDIPASWRSPASSYVPFDGNDSNTDVHVPGSTANLTHARGARQTRIFPKLMA